MMLKDTHDRLTCLVVNRHDHFSPPPESTFVYMYECAFVCSQSYCFVLRSLYTIHPIAPV